MIKLPVVKSLIITIVVCIIAFGWVLILMMEGMSDWYYALVGTAPIFAVVWVTIWKIIK